MMSSCAQSFGALSTKDVPKFENFASFSSKSLHFSTNMTERSDDDVRSTRVTLMDFGRGVSPTKKCLEEIIEKSRLTTFRKICEVCHDDASSKEHQKNKDQAVRCLHRCQASVWDCPSRYVD